MPVAKIDFVDCRCFIFGVYKHNIYFRLTLYLVSIEGYVLVDYHKLLV